MPLVIKYGGNAMTDDATREAVAAEIHKLHERGERPIVVHGGGPFIQAALDDAGIESRFERGLRVTSDAAMDVVERVLTLLGKRLAQDIGPAVGLSGRDARLLHAQRLAPELGRVGSINAVNAASLNALLDAGLVPVLACLALDEEDRLLNVNADDVAGAVAGTMRTGAVFLTNVPGVLDDPSRPDSLLSTLARADAEARIRDGRIAGGMLPKVEAGLAVLARGGAFATVADGRSAEGVRRAIAGGGGTRLTP